MDFSASFPDGFSWSGALGETDIRALYAACYSLRFSGRLELRDGAQSADVIFVGGEPVEIDGGDTQRISLWSRGTFRAVQSIPNLEGELTRDRELGGSLAVTKPSMLWAWIGQYRLTCEIDIERPGSRALVTFAHGHAESAQVNGQPELAALARVSSWTDGQFRVRLKPLFVDGVIPVAPPMPEGAPPLNPRQFDVSRSIPLDLKNQPKTPTPWPVPQSTARPIVPEDGRPPPLPERNRPATLPLADEDMVFVPARRSGAKFWIVSLTLLVIAGGVGALYKYHLPPFSRPPTPLVEPPVPPPPPKVETPPPPKVETPPPPKVETPPPPKKAPDKVDKIIAKGRLLLIEGHSHGALDQLHKAEKLRPKDASIKTLEQQAMGKLGHAELILDGKGALTLDGHKFQAPKKLKIAAGPHLVDFGDGESELSLKRGEKRHLKVKK